MRTREKDLILEGKNAKLSSPQKRLDALFQVLKLSEELYHAGKREFSTNET
ncbi:MAG: hypothetical protein ACFFCZ_09360 [Promethearchaeota archaeon]